MAKECAPTAPVNAAAKSVIQHQQHTALAAVVMRTNNTNCGGSQRAGWIVVVLLLEPRAACPLDVQHEQQHWRWRAPNKRAHYICQIYPRSLHRDMAPQHQQLGIMPTMAVSGSAPLTPSSVCQTCSTAPPVRWCTAQQSQSSAHNILLSTP